MKKKIKKDKLKEIRTDKDFSQEGLGYESNLTGRTINRLETGETDSMHINNINAIAKTLGVEPEVLIESKGD